MCAPVQDSAVVIDVLDLHTVLCLQRIENIKSSIQKKCNFYSSNVFDSRLGPSSTVAEHFLSWRRLNSHWRLSSGEYHLHPLQYTVLFSFQHFFSTFFAFTDPKPTSPSLTVADHFLFLEKAQLPLETREYISVICTPFKFPLYIPLQYSPSIFFFNIPL